MIERLGKLIRNSRSIIGRTASRILRIIYFGLVLYEGLSFVFKVKLR